MIIDCNVFSASVKYGVDGKLKSTHMSQQSVGTILPNAQISERIVQPCKLSSSNCHGTILASVLDRETVGCCFADQERRLSPTSVQYPIVEQRVVGHLGQPASEKARRRRLTLALMKCHVARCL